MNMLGNGMPSIHRMIARMAAVARLSRLNTLES